MSEFIEVVTDKAEKDIERLKNSMLEINDIVVATNKNLSNIKLPSQLKSSVKSTNEQLKQANVIFEDSAKVVEKVRLNEIKLQKAREKAFDDFEKKLKKEQEEREKNANKAIANAEKEKKAREKQVKAESDLRQRLLAQRKREEKAQERKAALDEKERLRTERLSSAYNKLTSALKEAEREYLDLAASQGKSSEATITARRNVLRLRSQIDGINEPIRRFGDNVGNYPQQFGAATSAIKGLIGAFGIVEGLELAFDFTKEAIELSKEAKGVEFAFKRLGKEGKNAFEGVKKSTRGLLSDVDIKRSLVEFDNFNLSLKESDTLFEFLSVRAAQTGKSVDSLRDSLVEGLSKESKLRIDNLGISAAELNTELDKTPDFVKAVANIAAREIKEAGNILDDSANSTEKWNASVNNLKISIGNLFTTGNGSGILGLLARQVNRISIGFSKLNESLGIVRRGFNELFTPVRNLLAQYPELNNGIQKFFDIITTPGITIFANALKFAGASLSGFASVIKEVRTSFNDFISSFAVFKDIDFTNPIQAIKGLANASKNVFRSAKTESKDLANAFKEGFLNALKPIEEVNKEVEKVNKTVSSGNAIRAEEKAILEQTISIYEALKQKQIDIATSFTSTSEETEKAFKNLEKFNKQIELLKGGSLEDIKGFDFEINADTSELTFLKNDIREVTQEMMELRKATDEFIKSISTNFIANSSFSSLTQFFDGTFNEIFEGAETLEEKTAVVFKAIADVSANAISIINEQNQLRFEAEISRLEKEKEVSLQFAGENAEAKRVIEEDFEERKAEIKRKSVQREKEASIFQTIINTAAGISAALANPGGPAGVALSVAVGLIGAAQTALILSTPVPQFAEGTDFAPGGWSLVNDQKGNLYKETIVTPKGDILKPQKRNTLIDLPRGSKVFTAKESLQHENELNYLLENNGILTMRNSQLPSLVMNSEYKGLTKDEMLDVMKQSVSKIQSNNVSIDKHGITTFTSNATTKKNILNNRVYKKGNRI